MANQLTCIQLAENELSEHRFNKVAEGIFGYEVVAVERLALRFQLSGIRLGMLQEIKLMASNVLPAT